MGKKPSVFVIIPFEENLLALYEALKKQFNNSFEFTNAGDLDNQQNILKDIVIGIDSADVVIADLTGLNPNVFYELGLAHAMGKKVIIITQNIDELPFDIKSYRANQYSLLFNKVEQLYEQLEKLLNGAMDGSVQFGSPVSDYIKPKDISTQEKKDIVSIKEDSIDSIESIDIESDENGKKGYFDFIADIEISMETLTSEIDTMQDNLNQMSNEMDKATDEINRVSKTGGSGTVSFVRNVSKKISLPVNTFALQLKNHISVISNNWSKVENDYLAFLDEDVIYKNNNLKDINANIEALEFFQTTMYNTDKNVESLIDGLKTCIGFERKLTKALTILITELQNYLSLTNTMVSSIDRIISKSKFVLYLGETK